MDLELRMNIGTYFAEDNSTLAKCILKHCHYAVLSFLLLLNPGFCYAQPSIKACGHHDYAPWNWLENDKIVGVCAELVTHLYKQLGYTVDLSYVGPWKRCQHLIEQGDIDINICSFKNAARKAYSVFSTTPVALNDNALFVQTKDIRQITNLHDLALKQVGIVRGVSFGTEIDNFLHTEANITIVEDYLRLFNMLRLGRVDALIMGRESGNSYLNFLKLQSELVAVDQSLVIGELFISASKRSPYVKTIQQLEPLLQSVEFQQWRQTLFPAYTERFMQSHHPNATQRVK